MIRRLGYTVEGLVVGINHAETATVTFRPFEIIHQSPDKIAAQSHTGSQRLPGSNEVIA